jgi:hypothetical protein
MTTINEAINDVAKDIVERLLKVKELKMQQEILEDEMKPLKEHFLNSMKGLGIEELKTCGATFKYKVKTRASVLKAGNGFQYLRDHNMSHLIKEEVDSRTLAKVFDELSKDGLIDLSDTETLHNQGFSVFLQDVLEVK